MPQKNDIRVVKTRQPIWNADLTEVVGEIVTLHELMWNGYIWEVRYIEKPKQYMVLPGSTPEST